MRYPRQQGLAMVEFAIVLPLLLFLMFAAAEFGRALFQYNTLLKAVRDGARYMAQNAFLGDGTQINGDAPTEAMNLVVYGSIAAKTCNPNDAYRAPCDDLPGFVTRWRSGYALGDYQSDIGGRELLRDGADQDRRRPIPLPAYAG